jgi:tetratricopeptide (TPR) repeat protein
MELGLDGNRYTEAHYQLSLIAWVTGELPEALKHINQAIDHGAGHPDAYLIRASILIDSGQYQNAARDIDRALKLELGAEDRAWALELQHELEVETKEA